MANPISSIKLPVLTGPPEGELSRRRFMALLGASAAVATGAGCKRAPDRSTVVPYTKKVEEIVPGIADYYASTFQEGEVAYPVLVKTREGRPIHVEGNDEHPLYRGKTSFHATADLLGLYDPDRLHTPLVHGRPSNWTDAIDMLAQGLKEAVASKRSMVLVTPAVLSPSRRALLADLGEALPGLRHVEWEPTADHGARRAAHEVFGETRRVRHRFDRAQVLVSLEADFLGTWGDTVAAIAGFAAARTLASASQPMNRLYVLEGGMSLTGTKADVRVPIRPSALPRVAWGLVQAVCRKSGRPLPAGLELSALEPFAHLPEAHSTALAALVDDLCGAGEKALVLAGPAASAETHVACHLLNSLLGAEGSTIATEEAMDVPTLASGEEFKKLVDEMAAGQMAAAIFWDVNPAYDYPDQEAWKSAMDKVPLRVRLGLLPDETAASASLVLPVNHWLESWNDFQTSSDILTLQQPVVAPLYDTLQGEDILLRCLGTLGRVPTSATYQARLKQRWQTEVQPKDSPIAFARFWNTCLHDGLFRGRATPRIARKIDGAACARAAETAARSKSEGASMELVLDLDARLHDGRYANNGWLQEMPDPVTKASWGNFLSISPPDADRLKLKNGDLVALGKGLVVPVLRQPGQAEGVLRFSFGYGRNTGSVAAGIGTRAWALTNVNGDRVVTLASIRPTGGHIEIPLAQSHDTKDGRDIARLLSLDEYAGKAPSDEKHEDLPSLYDKHEQVGPRWGMAIDLSACVGCGACVVACQSENNIPVVGPEQVLKGRAMHWMRVDRYYEGDAASPSVIHEPMLCQHCDNAPCETVCPVQATNHGPDGINQMAYNRCVGTRYCANNCPYKVRRFNFLDFTSDLPEQVRLAFNPEVSVRPRGVMEKCTFCVQRIRNAEQVAKREDRPVKDSEVVPACGSACPASAIVFGDIHNPESRVSKLAKSTRGFRVLEELGTKPAVTYLAALKNPPTRGGAR